MGYSRLFTQAILFGLAGIATAQTKKSVQPSPRFEVVSIRLSNPKSEYGQPEILPDGLRVHGLGLWREIADAYFPKDLYFPDLVQGLPSWANSEKYDIDARVSRAELTDWQNPVKQPAMLQTMLCTMLAERLKLAVRRVPGEMPGYALVVAKTGPKLKSSFDGEVFPSGFMKLPDGGEVVGFRPGEKQQVTFWGVSMADLARHMSGMSFEHPVLDKTGLTGRYDFVLAYRSMDAASDSGPIVVRPNDPDPLANWNVQALGLKLVPTKIPTETLVIDHIERPSEN